ncbi:condensation domain-containing protein [Kitasatospora sp. NPDC006697]|uniref:condensation domain-containing protein n=1 Tax=Kitasatospora sp. NPDC006697 TaxID=3364020 RepID=UPI003688F316
MVLEPVGTAPGAPLELELCGPLGTARAEAVAARLVERHRGHLVTLVEDPLGRHLLRLSPGPLSPDLLADLLAPSAGVDTLLPVTGRQREVLLAAVTGPDGPLRQLEQLHWNWSGPLDPAVFAAAWQSVADREVVLRASFDWTAAPRLVLHERAEVEVRHLPYTAVGWTRLLAEDRQRGFEPHRPGLLRVTLLAGPPGLHGLMPSTRILVTYHRALLDERGALLLVREFYRAYLAGGVLPGGERRPDIRDHARWLASQDTTAAREFWQATAPPPGAAVSVGRLGGPTGRSGPGRVQRRLRPSLTARVRSWAALRGVGESSVLHVAWALLLYRAAGAGGPTPVTFGVQLSGRELPLRGAAGIPGLLGETPPMTVVVDPEAPLADLLRQVRDSALDLTGYAWVPGELVGTWTAGPEPAELGGTLVHFDSGIELPQALRAELEDRSIQVDTPRSTGGDTILPVTLVAQYDGEGGLLLSATYDRAHLSDGDASGTLSQCLHLLRCLPDRQDPEVTVGQALALLDSAEVPRVARPGGGLRHGSLAVLRPGEPRAGVVCLVEVPGVPARSYELLARADQGPERLVRLSLDEVPRVLPAAVRELLVPGRDLVLGGCGPGAGAAYEIARQTAGSGVGAAAVVMAGIGAAADCADALARALAAARAQHLVGAGEHGGSG